MAIKIVSHAEPIPGYRLIERLGGGGFGEVWKAEAPGGFYKAIKFVYGELDTADDEEGARAEQELKALKRIRDLRHPFILSLERWDIIEGQLVIVMELADRSLWDRFKESRSQGMRGIPRNELLEYLRETGDALDFMNSQCNLQHLDIKPQNLFLVHNHIKVADFGLIKNLKGTAASVTGGVTPVYAAPETFDGHVRRTTDQYSLAIVYQELLTGERPFSGTTVRQLVMQHLQAEPDLSSLPPTDRAIIHKALHKDYQQRYPTCSDFVAALIAASTPQVEPLPTPPVLPKEQSDQDYPSISPSSRPTEGRPNFNEKEPHRTGEEPKSEFTAVTEKSTKPIQAMGSPSDETEVPGVTETPPSQPSTSPPILKSVPKVQADGVLMPGLVIGIGTVGQLALKHFRRLILENYGSAEALPNIRFLFMDTDQEAMQMACRGGESALRHSETFHTRLHRASHYLKDKNSIIEDWLNPKMVYRIPRQLVPGGVRALGRLAFVDNYFHITDRLEQELKACMEVDPIKKASYKTSLPIGSLEPRIYLLANLGGGTGSGMFIDLAYAVQNLLKRHHIKIQEIVGIFMVPQSGKKPVPPPILANSYAAFKELSHFSNQGTVFSAIYRGGDRDKKEKVSDVSPPFHRCILVPFEPAANSQANGDGQSFALNPSPSATQTANILFSELCTPIGRKADRERDKWTAIHCKKSPHQPNKMIFETAGLYRILWPKKQLLRSSANNLCEKLVKHWMSKDAKHLKESVKTWVGQHWMELKMDADQVILRLQDACQYKLGKKPESIFQEIVSPIAEAVVPVTNPQKNSKNKEIPKLAISTLVESLSQIDQYLGVPDGCQPLSGPKPTGDHEIGTLVEILTNESAGVGSESELKIAELIVRLIEQPEFRLAGAEETIRQFKIIVEKALSQQEELAKEIHHRTIELHKRIQELLQNYEKASDLESGWKITKRSLSPSQQLARDLLEALKIYPKTRYQSLILQQISGFFLSLRGVLSDQLREVDFCRQRLTELQNKFKEDEEDARSIHPLAGCPGKLLLPDGCDSLGEAVNKFLGKITAEDFNTVDHQIQEVIKKQYRALVHICMTSTGILRSLVPSMQATVIKFLATKLEVSDPVQLYLSQKRINGTDMTKVSDDLLEAYEEAIPGMGPPKDDNNLSVLGLPESEEADRIKEMVQQAAQMDELQTASTSDSITFYREQLYSDLTELRQITRQAKDAYEKALRIENFTPHSRLDIWQWQETE